MPKLSYTKKGQPFVRARLRARVSPDCAITITPTDVAKYTPPGPGENSGYLDVIVRPPVTVVRVDGPNFRDELLLDAPVETFEEIGFFSFFKKSKVSFDSRFARLSTNNPFFPNYKVDIFPVVGGNIAVPFPWLPQLLFGFSMYQNLGNLKATKSPVQISEFAFDTRYMFTGSESWGRPTFGPVVDYRGRNIYQTGSSADKPFAIGSLAMVGFGADVSWYFGAAFAPWESWASRFGFEASTRFYLGGKVANQSSSAQIFDGALMYRLSKKWAVGAGASLTQQSANFPATATDAAYKITDKISNMFLRISLVPYLEEAKK